MASPSRRCRAERRCGRRPRPCRYRSAHLRPAHESDRRQSAHSGAPRGIARSIKALGIPVESIIQQHRRRPMSDIIGHLKQLHRNGTISDRQFTRATGIPCDEIDDEQYQDADATAETGLPGHGGLRPRRCRRYQCERQQPRRSGEQGPRPDAERQGSHHRRGEGRERFGMERKLVPRHQRAQPKLNPSN